MGLLRLCLTLDSSVRTVIASHHTPILDIVMVAALIIGRRAGVCLALGALTAFRRRSTAQGVWQMILAIGLAALMSDAIVKPVVGRLRPFESDPAIRVIDKKLETRSFPSGHAATAFAGAYALARVWPEARAGLWALAALTAVSRIYVGAHYPLDVLAGALLGVVCAAFVVGGSIWYDRGSARRLPPVPR